MEHVNSYCARCGTGPETILHALKWCPKAHEVWRELKYEWEAMLTGINEGNMMTKFLTLTSVQFQQLVFTFWGIWTVRNSEVHEGTQRLPINVAAMIINYVVEYNKALTKEAEPRVVRRKKWKAPEQGRFKVNYDGAFYNKEMTGGIGVVVRDASGALIGALSTRVLLVSEPAMIESLAAVRALEFARDLGILDVEVEGDALSVIRKLQSSEPNMSSMGIFTEDACQISKAFRRCSFMHTYREGNQAAHLLAKYGLNCHSDFYWVEECPDVIQNTIAQDVLCLHE